MMKKVAKFGNQPDVKKLAAQCAIHSVVCCALCNDELTDTEINTNLQMGAPECDAICERCWQQRNQENYEQYEP